MHDQKNGHGTNAHTPAHMQNERESKLVFIIIVIIIVIIIIFADITFEDYFI